MADIRNIVRLAREVQADALLCAGDLFEQARYTPFVKAEDPHAGHKH